MAQKTFLIGGFAALALTACGNSGTDAPIEPQAGTASPSETDEAIETATQGVLNPALQEVAEGNYSIEKTHAFMTIKVGHGGSISQYRISFTDFDGKLAFDPANPEASSITFNINPLSVETNYPGDYKASHANSQWQSWNEDVARDDKWLNADQHPEITFVSTFIDKDGDLSGKVTGDLTLLGVTKSVTLDVTYNGLANPPWFNGRDVIGFDATTKIKRSDFGMGAAIPNISDNVTVEFSGEFLQDE